MLFCSNRNMPNNSKKSPKITESKVLKFLREYKEKEERHYKDLQFIGPSSIAVDMSADEPKVLEICDKLRREGKIEEATVRTEYGRYFGYRIKD